MNTRRVASRSLIGASLLVLAACGPDSTAPGGGRPPVSVSVVPATASLLTSGSQDFTATVAHDPSNGGVTWSITGCSGEPAACGSLSRVTITQATYTAPTKVPPGTLGVTATSVTDHSKSVAARVAITAIAAARLAAGSVHTCSLNSSGAAYCWGAGQLGDGSTTISASPVAVSGGLSFRALTASESHTCGLTSAGAAYCWGRNDEGELGDGSTTDRATPVAVAGGLSFSALATGGGHTCGLTSAGAAYCWGSNNFGQRGDGSPPDRTTPVAVAGGLSFSALVAGARHTCALTSAGLAYCWGQGGFGQLGDGSQSTARTTPVAVAGGLSFSALTAGGFYTCSRAPGPPTAGATTAAASLAPEQ
jgi:Regulator of Chromosome Condensation (RCC1) repeat protein